MKLENLERNKRKKIVIGVVVFLCLLFAIIYTGSRAKYKVTESIPLVNGTINYEIGDFNVVAMYQASDSGDYTEISKMPNAGYAINEEKSYCKVNGTKDDSVKLYTNSSGEHVIGNLQKNSKCYVWFDIKEMTIPQMIARHNPTVGPTEFTSIANTDEGLLTGEDDDGTTYYFRGNVTNNWIYFAGFYWRIIRINGDGSIRLIYNGETTNQTGEGTQIGTKAFNTSYKDNPYIGYMYGSPASTYEETLADNKYSTILGTTTDTTTLLGWYKKNIYDKDFSKYISKEAGFCNDRMIAPASTGYTSPGHSQTVTMYNPSYRIFNTNYDSLTTQTPTFKCNQENTDLFTTSSSNKGNKEWTHNCR